MGLNSTAVPDDAFKLLKDSPEQIGDVKITKRNNLGDNWKLCDGTIVSVESGNAALEILGDNGVNLTLETLNARPSIKDSRYWADKRGIYVANGQLFSCIGTGAPNIYNEQTKTFDSLDNLSKSDDSSGIWYANGYYFYGT